MKDKLWYLAELGANRAKARPRRCSHFAELVPRRDMELDGFRRNIYAHVIFAAWLDSASSGAVLSALPEFAGHQAV
jgi:hypothetical protein